MGDECRPVYNSYLLCSTPVPSDKTAGKAAGSIESNGNQGLLRESALRRDAAFI